MKLRHLIFQIIIFSLKRHFLKFKKYLHIELHDYYFLNYLYLSVLQILLYNHLILQSRISESLFA